jgi:hypothetical protein
MTSDQESVWNALKQMARLEARATAAEAENAKLREALEELLHAYCSDTGFAAAVRQDTGLAYPWEPGEIAEAKARAALETDNG